MNCLISRDSDPDYIEHYGVMGMKWGHRRTKYMSAYTQAKRNFKDEKKYVQAHWRYRKTECGEKCL